MINATPCYITSSQFPLNGTQKKQYIYAATLAASHLNWNVVFKDDSIIICYTDSFDYMGGYKITASPVSKTVTFTAESLGYDNDIDVVGQQFIEKYYKAIEDSLAKLEVADRNLHPMHREKYGALLISKSYKTTPVLVYINLLLYLVMIVSGVSPFSPSAKDLYDWGGNYGLSVNNGEWWRLITYMFLHGGAMHFIMNAFALLYVGMHLEPLIGKFRFATAYLYTGICAAFLSMYIHANTVSVGASGAIFGMYGVFISILTTNHIQKTLRKTMLRSMLFFVVYNLMMGLQGNTDNAAHIGGLISGFVIGYIYFPGIIRKTSIFSQIVISLLLLGVICGIGMLLV